MFLCILIVIRPVFLFMYFEACNFPYLLSNSNVPSILIKEFQAPFDSASVDNMRRLTEHAGVPGHIYPLAILCYDIMPPPPQVHPYS